jgi:hypothetical protein
MRDLSLKIVGRIQHIIHEFITLIKKLLFKGFPFFFAFGSLLNGPIIFGPGLRFIFAVSAEVKDIKLCYA